jgi:protein SCO1/2
LSLLSAQDPLRAAVTQHDLAGVEVTTPSKAAVPMDLLLRGEDDIPHPLRLWLPGKPAVLVLADYTCETLCGPVISIVSGALAQSGLPRSDYRFVVIGLDPKDTAADAARMRRAQIGPDDEGPARSAFLRGDAAAIGALTKALGFAYTYDGDRDQFAHPAAAFVIAPDGRLARALSGLAVDPAMLRLAIVDAANGTVGTWTDHVRLLCYGYDPASGTYTIAIRRILATAAGLTVVSLALLIGLLLRHQHAGQPAGPIARRFGARSRTSTID